jgi:Tfp pilus assembly protein PilV
MSTKNRSGFTLVEVTVAGLLMVVLGVGILGLQYVIGRLQITAFSSFQSSDEANTIVSTISRELRTARAGDNGSFLIEAGAADSLTFYSDVDFDGQVEKVQYTRTGTSMTRSVTKPTGYPVTYLDANKKTRTISTTIRNGTTSVFTYYNGNWPSDTTGNPMPTPINLLNVKMIKIYVRSNTETNHPAADYIGQSFVTLRMAKTNL